MPWSVNAPDLLRIMEQMVFQSEGGSLEDSHCLVFITEGVTERTQLKSNIFHVLNLHGYSQGLANGMKSWCMA